MILDFKTSSLHLIFALLGGATGLLWTSLNTTPPSPLPERVEISIIEFLAIEGDQLKIEVFGPARLLWGEGKMLEGSGTHLLPLGQIADLVDLKFKNFAYTANAKTGKFYPSSSYPARGTAIRDRRFYNTKKEAIDAGFIPTKLVK